LFERFVTFPSRKRRVPLKGNLYVWCTGRLAEEGRRGHEESPGNVIAQHRRESLVGKIKKKKATRSEKMKDSFVRGSTSMRFGVPGTFSNERDKLEGVLSKWGRGLVTSKTLRLVIGEKGLKKIVDPLIERKGGKLSCT